MSFIKRIKQIFNIKETEEDFRKWYHKCRHCKHAVLEGRSYATDKDVFYCVHPDTHKISNLTLNKINPEGYCTKFELPEAFSIELMNRNLENTLSREAVDSQLRSAKNLGQGNTHLKRG